MAGRDKAGNAAETVAGGWIPQVQSLRCGQGCGPDIGRVVAGPRWFVNSPWRYRVPLMHFHE